MSFDKLLLVCLLIMTSTRHDINKNDNIKDNAKYANHSHDVMKIFLQQSKTNRLLFHLIVSIIAHHSSCCQCEDRYIC